jgi:hypothetical protein
MKSLLIYVLSLAAWSAFLVTAALAQSPVPFSTQPATQVSVLPLYQIAEPYIMVVFATTFPLLFAWLCYQFQKRTGIKISDSARAQVQQAAFNGAGRILAAQEGPLANVKIDVHSPLVAQEATKVAALVPDALAKIGVTPDAASDVLSSLIAGKVGILQASTTAPAPVNVSVVPPAGTSVTTTAS